MPASAAHPRGETVAVRDIWWQACGVEEMPPSRERDAILADMLARLENLVRRCDLPLLGLQEPAPTPRLVGVEDANGVVETVDLVYGDPAVEDGPLVHVRTTRRGAATAPSRLDDLLAEAAHPDASGIGPVDAVETVATGPVVAGDTEPIVVLVDGASRPGRMRRAGARWWAVRCVRGDVDVTVVARDWTLEETRLVSAPDVEQFLRGQRAYLTARLALAPSEPEPVPFDVRYAHRDLVRAALAEAGPLQQRGRAGRRPRARAAAAGRGRWEAAVRAQMHLADQERTDADEAVTALVNQLVSLAEDAAWFADEALRHAAVTQTLLYWTELCPTVTSRHAQEAWRRVWGLQRNGPPSPAAGEQAQLRSWFSLMDSERAAWLHAWAGWAKAQERS